MAIGTAPAPGLAAPGLTPCAVVVLPIPGIAVVANPFDPAAIAVPTFCGETGLRVVRTGSATIADPVLPLSWHRPSRADTIAPVIPVRSSASGVPLPAPATPNAAGALAAWSLPCSLPAPGLGRLFPVFLAASTLGMPIMAIGDNVTRLLAGGAWIVALVIFWIAMMQRRIGFDTDGVHVRSAVRTRIHPWGHVRGAAIVDASDRPDVTRQAVSLFLPLGHELRIVPGDTVDALAERGIPQLVTLINAHCATNETH